MFNFSYDHTSNNVISRERFFISDSTDTLLKMYLCLIYYLPSLNIECFDANEL